MTTTIIFDFFGVFASSMATNWFNTTKAATPIGRQKFQALCTQSDLGQISKQEFITKAAELTGIAPNKITEGIEQQLHLNTALVTYTEELLGQGYRVACLSNGSHEWTTYAIEKLKIAHLFERVVISSEVKMVKPDPRIYMHTLNLLDATAHECVFVDDRLANTEAAEALGIKSFLFRDFVEFKAQLTKYLVN